MAETGVWVLRNGQLVPKHLAPPLHAKHREGPMVISGTMDLTWNPADGKHYDDKRSYEKAVRRAGCEIIGNEKPSASARSALPDPSRDVVAAIEQVESRTPATRAKRKSRSKRGTAS